MNPSEDDFYQPTNNGSEVRDSFLNLLKDMDLRPSLSVFQN
jgi:hypothetical protein